MQHFIVITSKQTTNLTFNLMELLIPYLFALWKMHKYEHYAAPFLRRLPPLCVRDGYLAGEGVPH